jgi:hypothetical protein
MNRELYMRAKRQFSIAAGSAAGLDILAQRSGLSIAERESAKLREALVELEKLVDESRKETQRREVPS